MDSTVWELYILISNDRIHLATVQYSAEIHRGLNYIKIKLGISKIPDFG